MAASPFQTQWLHALVANHALQAEIVLRRLLEKNTDASVTLHPPDTIYSLSSRSTLRLFRRSASTSLSSPVPKGARVVHWKVSPATKPHETQISPDHIMNHACCQSYSTLVWNHASAVKKIVYL
ncbi:hypothetical protein [Acetobacter oeni]|uniref:hypothetical protein n=1 Tax=Acetobacter oeni TaxID=304077 RepID=UPI0011BE571C|nr:hypothetical protein [Acetobacter oeni]MBB3884779.1 hypothetical protein [Acetobacter oeni]NHO20697.1 hypothetical protein [Acetobacter oeni]